MEKKEELPLRAREGSARHETVGPVEADCPDCRLRGPGGEDKIEIISFFLDDAEYAFEVAGEVEVLRPRKITEVPGTPDFVKGILPLRGEMLPVIDLKRRINAGSSRPMSGRILVIPVDDLRAGFVVDRLSGVKEVSADSLTPDDGCDRPEFLRGAVHVNGKAIRLLDAVKLIDFGA